MRKTRLLYPAGQHIVTAGQHVVTVGQHVVTAGQQTVTAGQPMVTAAKHVVTAGQLMVTASQHVVTAGQQMVTAGQHVVTVSQLMVTVGQHGVTAGQLMVTAGQYVVCLHLTVLAVKLVPEAINNTNWRNKKSSTVFHSQCCQLCLGVRILLMLEAMLMLQSAMVTDHDCLECSYRATILYTFNYSVSSHLL